AHAQQRSLLLQRHLEGGAEIGDVGLFDGTRHRALLMLKQRSLVASARVPACGGSALRVTPATRGSFPPSPDRCRPKGRAAPGARSSQPPYVGGAETMQR